MRPFLDDAKRRVDRKLSARRQSLSASRFLPSALPDRLKDNHDAQVDFTAPPGGSGSREGHLQYMQQSIFGMIAAVGSRAAAKEGVVCQERNVCVGEYVFPRSKPKIQFADRWEFREGLGHKRPSPSKDNIGP
ncbi:hypothetical protein KXX66_008822 [Aspergillus fumigatus]|nr:hypothetical protein KXX66_008822 [Aspergillus fumigatus]